LRQADAVVGKVVIVMHGFSSGSGLVWSCFS